MEIRKVLVLVLVFVVGLIGGIFIRGNFLTGEVVSGFEEYSYTRAVCSDGGCIDVVVLCSDGDVVDIEPIFYLVEHEEEWNDPRTNDSSGFCG